MRKKLGKCPIQAGLITEDEPREALAQPKHAALARLGHLCEGGVRCRRPPQGDMAEMRSRSLGLRGSGGPALAAVLATVLLACCSPGARRDSEASSTSATQAAPAPAPVLAEAKAEWPGLVVQIIDVKRNAGTVSIRLLFANTSQQLFEFGDRFASDPADRDTLADVVLVEPSGLRKYFVLRDRANRPAGSGALSPLRPGERRPILVRFPAPPAGTSRITIQIPHVPVIRDVPIS